MKTSCVLRKAVSTKLLMYAHLTNIKVLQYCTAGKVRECWADILITFRIEVQNTWFKKL